MKITDSFNHSYMLSDKDKVGEGGEGEVFIKGDKAFKIWHPSVTPIPETKISELNKLTDKRIIKPESSIFSNGKRVGYWMRAISGGKPLCTFFTTPAQKRSNIIPSTINDICHEMAEVMTSVHDANCLIVDANEMNWLLDDINHKLWIIDTDAWQTPSHHATAVMPSIRDPRTKNNKFDKESDWYGWGIVTFQLWTGIHPYKGKESSGMNFLDRMDKGISVFHNSVSVPPVVRDWNNIPAKLLTWYKDTFQNGKRSAPPGFVQITQIQVIKASKALTIWKFSNDRSTKEKIVDCHTCNLNVIAWSDITVFYNNNQYSVSIKPDWVIDYESTLYCWNEKTLRTLDGTIICVHPDAKFTYPSSDGTFFVVNNDGAIYHYKLLTVGKNIHCSSSLVGNTTPGHKTGLNGNFIHYLLGMPYWRAYVPKVGHIDIQLKELKGKTIVSWFAENGCLAITVKSQNMYETYFRHYESSVCTMLFADTSASPTRFALTDNGIIVMPTTDGAIAFNKTNSNKHKVINEEFPDNIFTYKTAIGSWSEDGWVQVGL